jgi:hypothetical protein
MEQIKTAHLNVRFPSTQELEDLVMTQRHMWLAVVFIFLCVNITLAQEPDKALQALSAWTNQRGSTKISTRRVVKPGIRLKLDSKNTVIQLRL